MCADRASTRWCGVPWSPGPLVSDLSSSGLGFRLVRIVEQQQLIAACQALTSWVLGGSCMGQHTCVNGANVFVDLSWPYCCDQATHVQCCTAHIACEWCWGWTCTSWPLCWFAAWSAGFPLSDQVTGCNHHASSTRVQVTTVILPLCLFFTSGLSPTQSSRLSSRTITSFCCCLLGEQHNLQDVHCLQPA